nr:MAG TPA: hypothetical protein [Caudoviricetes sp.]
MDVEAEYRAAQRDIVNKILESGLFEEHTAEDVAANAVLRHISRTDKSFASVLVAYLSGRIDKDKVQAIINERLKNEQ